MDEFFIWKLFLQLQRRKFPLGPEDYEDLRRALKLGFGWTSRRALRDLCCSLWAKSLKDREIIKSLFDRIPQTELTSWHDSAVGVGGEAAPGCGSDEPAADPADDAEHRAPKTRSLAGLPEINLPVAFITDFPFAFAHLYPVTYRETAQAWRRLREPMREGPAVEIDVDATIDRRCRSGVVTPIVLAPRRRNTARLLLLVDRNGSMTPYHHFVDEVSDAIRHSGSLKAAGVYYFHNLPTVGAAAGLPEDGGPAPFPDLDPWIGDIAPQTDGYVYPDQELLTPCRLADALAEAAGAGVAIISDAGAARRRMRNQRLLDTIAFLKGLKLCCRRYVWLNPAEPERWPHSTAQRLARHIPMFPLTAAGLHRAVDALKGRPVSLACPL